MDTTENASILSVGFITTGILLYTVFSESAAAIDGLAILFALIGVGFGAIAAFATYR